jgi:hypothetical protein
VPPSPAVLRAAPPPPAGTVYAVYVGVQLLGVVAATFSNDTVRAAFIAAAAATVNVAPGAVAITAASAAAATGRRLAQTAEATQVSYQMYTLSAASASGVSAAVVAEGGVSLTALQNGGINATAVVLTGPPTLGTLLAPPQPPSPFPPPPPPAGCGSAWLCFATVQCATASTCGPCPAGLAGDGRTCTPCTLRVAIAPLAGNASARATDAVLSGVASAAEGTACSTTGGFTFAWSTTALSATGALLALPVASSPSLLLPARSLGAGQTASFTLTACLAGAPSTCAAASYGFAVRASPLVALIGGGGGTVGETLLTLSAASSYDPDGAPSAALAFAWSCTRTDGASSACAARDGTPVVLGSAVTQALLLAGAAGAGATYTITLTVSEGSRSATANTTLTVKPGALPLVAIAGNAVLAGAKANPSASLVLLANATAFVSGAVSTRWSLAAQSGVAGPLLNVSDPAVCATPVTSASMVIKPGALAAGARYTFTLSATDAVGSAGSANATIITSTPPRGGWAAMAPASGVALSTPFVLTASGWTADADELPLTYAAEYIIEGSAAPPVSLTGGAFQSSPAISMLLPAGLAEAGSVVTVRLTVRSAWGATATANASVAVTWPPFADASAVNAFVDGALERAVADLQRGEAPAALQVVAGLASLLNDADANNNTEAATQQRAILLSIVAAAVNQSSGALVDAPAAVESTAALVLRLVAVPAQLSDAGAASALAVLGSIASAGSAVSPVAAQSVADALSSVVQSDAAAASSGGTLSAVLDVLGALAGSQASGLAVPGQAAATVMTSALSMLVALDAADSPRLLQQPITAPGSASSFDPLGPDALAAANGAAVSTVFLSTRFDGHGGASSNNTGGMTRLAFSSGGEALTVAGLSTPILFSMPASTLAADQQASCAWWDDAAAAYITAGCTALPSPHPPGHDLAFAPGFVASGPGSLALAWSIRGPLLAGCEEAVLDCGNATQRAAPLLLGAPVGVALGCGRSTSAVLRAFTGARCALSNATGDAACAWNAPSQAFAGAGCVPAAQTRCACLHLTDFTSAPAVKIPVASLADMLSYSAADIVTKLRLLFILVISLFGAMHVGGVIALLMDVRERARVNTRLCDEACGFRVTADGAWLWRFSLDPLPDGVELTAPSGPAVELAAVLGM